MPFKLIEVKNEVVESFLGRIRDPEETILSDISDDYLLFKPRIFISIPDIWLAIG